MNKENFINKANIQHKLEMINQIIKSIGTMFNQTYEDEQLTELKGYQFNWADKQLYKLCTQHWGMPKFLPHDKGNRFIWNYSVWTEKKAKDAELVLNPRIILNDSEIPGTLRWYVQRKILRPFGKTSSYEMRHLSWCSAWECSKFLDIKLDPNVIFLDIKLDSNDNQYEIQKQLHTPPDYFREADRTLFDACYRILGEPKVIVKDCGTKLSKNTNAIDLAFCEHLEWGGGGFKPNTPQKGSFGITVPLERPHHIMRHVEPDGTSHLTESINSRDIWSVIITNSHDCQEQRIEKNAEQVINFLCDCGILHAQYVQKTK